MTTTAVRVLLVEDCEEDVELICEAFKQSLLTLSISIVHDGQQALEFLYQKEKYKDAPSPDLIILDLNLPKKDGHQVLHKIKSDPQLRIIPVVILSTSRSYADILSSYENYTNCYICKPSKLEEFSRVIREIEKFWLNITQLPVDVHHGER